LRLYFFDAVSLSLAALSLASIVQQAFLSAQHFSPALQQAGFALVEQQADLPSQQASFAAQQSATCAAGLAPAFFARQQQVLADTSATEPFAAVFCAGPAFCAAVAQQALPFAQQALPSVQQAGFLSV
jgi:hypothetical protein